MANYKQNKAFGEHMLPKDPLDEAIEWIRENLLPEDVFPPVVLIDWALDNGFVKVKE